MRKILIAKDAAEKAMVAEACRTESLLHQTVKLVAGILVVLGFQLLDIKMLLVSPSPWVKCISYASVAALGVSTFFAFFRMNAKGHANYPRGNKLWDNLKPENISEEAADEALLQILLKTREQNALLNDARARSLLWCGRFLFLGIILVAGSQLLDASLYALHLNPVSQLNLL